METVLRWMRRFFAYYLGVTPPPPEKEKAYFFLLVGGLAAFVCALALFAGFLMRMLFGS